MTKLAKLIAAVRNNPKDVRFDDALKIADHIGFSKCGGSGSHHTRAKPGETTQLNFQNRGGKIKPYQVKQLLKMLDKYESDGNE